MTIIRTLTAAVMAAFILQACSEPTTPAQTATLTDAATPAPEGVPTPETLIGRWGDNGDCTKDIVFSADGNFRSFTGGTGQWSLAGDVLTIAGPDGTFQVRVAIADENTLMIGNADGSFGMSQRCP